MELRDKHQKAPFAWSLMKILYISKIYLFRYTTILARKRTNLECKEVVPLV